jgi:hypothetical protein
MFKMPCIDKCSSCDKPSKDIATAISNMYQAYVNGLSKPKPDPDNLELTDCEKKYNKHIYAVYQYSIGLIELPCLIPIPQDKIKTCVNDRIDTLITGFPEQDLDCEIVISANVSTNYSVGLTPKTSTDWLNPTSTGIIQLTSSNTNIDNPIPNTDWVFENNVLRAPCVDDSKITYNATIYFNFSSSTTGFSITYGDITSSYQNYRTITTTNHTRYSDFITINNIPCNSNISTLYIDPKTTDLYITNIKISSNDC